MNLKRFFKWYFAQTCHLDTNVSAPFFKFQPKSLWKILRIRLWTWNTFKLRFSQTNRFVSLLSSKSCKISQIILLFIFNLWETWATIELYKYNLNNMDKSAQICLCVFMSCSGFDLKNKMLNKEKFLIKNWF